MSSTDLENEIIISHLACQSDIILASVVKIHQLVQVCNRVATYHPLQNSLTFPLHFTVFPYPLTDPPPPPPPRSFLFFTLMVVLTVSVKIWELLPREKIFPLRVAPPPHPPCEGRWAHENVQTTGSPAIPSEDTEQTSQCQQH